MVKSILGSAGVAVALVAAVPASAVVFATSGNTTSGLTYNRPLAGDPPTGLSAVGTAVRYTTLSFTVSAAGNYGFLMAATTVNYDPFLTLYQTSFNPAAPLANALVANDDQPTGNLTQSGFSRALLTSTSYILVFTGFDNADFGAFNLTIDGPGTVNVPNGAVPEPATWAMMIGGFGAIGGAMRYRRRKVTVSFA